MNPGRAMAGSLVVALITAATVLPSVWPFGASPQDGAIRLAWRSAPVVIEECRELSTEELADIPTHMRQTRLCEGKGVPYRVTLEVDGLTLVDERIIGTGRRHDRPLFVFADVRYAPGRYTLGVTFAPDTVLSSIPDSFPTLSYREVVRLDAGEVVLITRGDGQAGQLTRR